MQATQFFAGHQLDRIKKIDRRVVHDPRFRHRFPEVGRSGEILGRLRVLGVEDHDNLTLVIGRAEDAHDALNCLRLKG
jgi:hypothetical protein